MAVFASANGEFGDMQLHCPHCGRLYSVAGHLSGRLVICRQCNQNFRIPTNEVPTPPAASRLAGFIGQSRIITSLERLIEIARSRGTFFPHLLLSGPPDIGKASLALLIAQNLEVGLQVAEGRSLNYPRDIIPFLTNAEQGSVLLINDADLLREEVCRFLIPAMSEFQIDIVLGDGINARTLNMSLRRFSAVLATSRPSRIDERLRRTTLAFDFGSYTNEEMTQIVRSLAVNNGLRIQADAIELIASYCDGLPGKAGVLIKQLRDYFGSDITRAVATEALTVLGYSVGQPLSVSMPAKLKRMTGGEFEEFVGSLFRRMGYSVELTSITGDHGIDLLLRKDGALSVAQCKRWENSVGEPIVRDFLGSIVGVGATYGYLVTTSYFTGQAIAFAANRPIRLIDLDGLIHLSNESVLPTTTLHRQPSPRRSLFDDP